jgi:Protein of unknown function (DUF3050)
MSRSEPHLNRLTAHIEPVRTRLTNHPMYQSVRTPGAFKTFMEFHVYAVWDFMSLLKALQRDLTCVQIPWVPVGSADTRYLINEIVLGEESDVDEQGNRISHYELYLRAMHQAHADTRPITALVEAIKTGMAVDQAAALYAPDSSVQDFLRFTFDTIATGKTHAIASVFTYGREDLIPDLFLPIVGSFPKEAAEPLHIFKYYLERHIEVDGDHHSHLAIAMLEELCGDDPAKWEEATAYARAALEARIRLWDGVLDALSVPA